MTSGDACGLKDTQKRREISGISRGPCAWPYPLKSLKNIITKLLTEKTDKLKTMFSEETSTNYS